MELKEIVLAFENCDGVTIDGKAIKGICLADIRESIVGFNSNVETRKKIKNFALYIDKSANKSFDNPECYLSKDYFARIADEQDIVGITLVYKKDENNVHSIVKETYGVYWEDIKAQCNPAQKAYITKAGDLCLVVSKKKNINDFFWIYEDEESEDVSFNLVV